ncbi:MAG TPA: Uma2 family endonuclease [Bryobacteraceae bacterium]|jgi:Uma2 family endonuclease|nr:Uma2 family endonuclease [Bryobacteraceae bacterium]
MGTSVLVSEQEYLTTTYEPDCEHDEGVLLERNVGAQPHSLLQVALGLTAQRIRIAPRKYRIPDVCAYLQPAPPDPVPSTPPFMAIEILSPEDRMSRVRKKIDEYLAFGVPYVWVIRRSRYRSPAGRTFPGTG